MNIFTFSTVTSTQFSCHPGYAQHPRRRPISSLCVLTWSSRGGGGCWPGNGDAQLCWSCRGDARRSDGRCDRTQWQRTSLCESNAFEASMNTAYVSQTLLRRQWMSFGVIQTLKTESCHDANLVVSDGAASFVLAYYGIFKRQRIMLDMVTWWHGNAFRIMVLVRRNRRSHR